MFFMSFLLWFNFWVMPAAVVIGFVVLPAGLFG